MICCFRLQNLRNILLREALEKAEAKLDAEVSLTKRTSLWRSSIGVIKNKNTTIEVVFLFLVAGEGFEPTTQGL